MRPIGVAPVALLGATALALTAPAATAHAAMSKEAPSATRPIVAPSVVAPGARSPWPPGVLKSSDGQFGRLRQHHHSQRGHRRGHGRLGCQTWRCL